jgi:hypothetical protein
MKKGALKAECVLNVKDESPNMAAAGKGLMHACASRDAGPHAMSAKNSLMQPRAAR